MPTIKEMLDADGMKLEMPSAADAAALGISNQDIARWFPPNAGNPRAVRYDTKGEVKTVNDECNPRELLQWRLRAGQKPLRLGVSQVVLVQSPNESSSVRPKLV